MINPSIDGLIRHVLTGVGGVLIAKGVLDDAALQSIIGGTLAVVGVIWSLFNKRKEAE